MFTVHDEQFEYHLKSALYSARGHQLPNPDRDTIEFDQGRVTKNQPITVLVLLSQSSGIHA